MCHAIQECRWRSPRTCPRALQKTWRRIRAAGVQNLGSYLRMAPTHANGQVEASCCVHHNPVSEACNASTKRAQSPSASNQQWQTKVSHTEQKPYGFVHQGRSASKRDHLIFLHGGCRHIFCAVRICIGPRNMEDHALDFRVCGYLCGDAI